MSSTEAPLTSYRRSERGLEAPTSPGWNELGRAEKAGTIVYSLLLVVAIAFLVVAFLAGLEVR
jgi:hypothetical protein